MEVVNLNNNATMQDILLGLPSGKIKRYILSLDNIERLSPIIRLANRLSSDKHVYIEVKFDSQYNSRPKRLEVVAVGENIIEIYKFSKKSSFEKECLEVQRTIDELKPKTKCKIIGYIVLPDLLNEYNDFYNRVKEISTDILITKE